MPPSCLLRNAALLLAFFLSMPSRLAAGVAAPPGPAPSPLPQSATPASQPAESGRVVATITSLDGGMPMSGVDVELLAVPDGIALAKTVTDGVGHVEFPDVPPGRYQLRASRPGFLSRTSPGFDVQAGMSTPVLLDIPFTFVLPPVEVRADAPGALNSVRPVSMSDMLSGSVLDIAPLPGDDFQSLLPLLPGVVRGPDGRLRIKGGQPTQGALQVSSASLVDPSSGEFDLDLPSQSVESVEVLANPFAAEYGRFSTSITQVRTRRGTNDWEFAPGNLMPRLRGFFRGIRGFEPRFSARGPIRPDRVFLAQDFQLRYVATPVRSLPDEPEIVLKSVDSFTRLDTVLSPRHTLGGGLIAFPRRIDRATMTTFRPPGTTPRFRQNGLSTGIVDRFAITPDMVLETTVAGRYFEIEVGAEGLAPMTYAPQTQGGAYFNEHEREVGGFQWVEALTVSRDRWSGQHVFKFGIDLQRSNFDGFSESRPVQVLRADGSLAELIDFGGRRLQQSSGVEFGAFAQDRWRVGSRVTFELGLRLDRDQIIENVNWSPRGGVAIAVLPEGRGILRGGMGKFVQRTPLNIDAFPAFEPREVTRFAPDGSILAPPVTYRNVPDPGLRTPEAIVGNVEWNQRFGRRFLVKFNFLQRRGSHEYIVLPDAQRGELRLASAGESRYKEVEATVRYLGSARRDLTLSYVWSRSTADLNNYDQFFGNFRNPIVRPNERSLTPTDVPHRLLIRGTIGLPGQWDFAPVVEVRSGFPWSAVDEFQDFVGPRNRTGRLPRVNTFDFSITRPWRFKKYTFRAGIRMYNAFGADANRDVQNNVAAPDFGRFYNPIERSFGITFGVVR